MFIVLQPNSNTNKSDTYAVVDGEAWTRYVNGASLGFAVLSRHDNYVAAKKEAERMTAENR